MSEETTSEQLAEIEGQAAEPPVAEYTPPDGYRLLQIGEVIQKDDIFLAVNGEHWTAKRIGETVNNNRYLRRTEVENCGFEGKILGEVSQPQPQPEPQQPEPVQVREGRWRTRGGDIKNIRACEPLKGAYYVWPWTDGFMTFQDNGRHQGSKESPNDLVYYLGPLEQQPEPEKIITPDAAAQQLVRGLVSQVAAAIEQESTEQPQPEPETIEEPRGEVEIVHRLLGNSQLRVTELEELVASLRTINEGTEKSVRLANQQNTDLKHRLNVVSAEWAEQAETIRRLQIELDAAQQSRQSLKQANDTQAETIGRLMSEARDLNMEIGGLQRQTEQQKSRIEFLETLNAGNGAAIECYRAQVAKLQGLVETARQQLEAAATERDELRAAIDTADKQLDQKDAQICDLRIELDAAQQVPQPVSDEERERIWDEATEQAGQLVIRWLRPLTQAMIRQPDERFCRFMAMTLSILPDILPELLGYAVEDKSLDTGGEPE